MSAYIGVIGGHKCWQQIARCQDCEWNVIYTALSAREASHNARSLLRDHRRTEHGR